MLEAFSAVIYSALLSSRSSTGTCSSSRSTARVIVDCMHGRHQSHTSKDVPRKNANGKHVLHRFRQEARPSLFTPAGHLPRRGDMNNLRKTVRRHPGFLNPSCARVFNNRPCLSQSSHLRLANPRSLPIHCSIASIHSRARIPAGSSPTLEDHQGSVSLTIQQRQALERFRSHVEGPSSESGDLESAWVCFDDLRASDILSWLSHDELLGFSARVYNGSRLTLHEPKTVSREMAVRLGRLHDMLQHRAENSPDAPREAFRTWSTSLAVQTLIWAGKLEKALQLVTETFVESKGQVVPQQITSLQQLFLASTQQHSLEFGLIVLARTWFWIRSNFHMHTSNQDDGMSIVAEDLRRTVTFAFGTFDEASVFLRTIEDKAVQGVGTSIFAFVYGSQESAEKVYSVYCDFVSRGLSMPLETHLRFLMVLLLKEAYTLAYVMRKRILSHFPGKQADRELAVAFCLLPDLVPQSPGQDVLAFKAASSAKARFFSCIEDPPPAQADLLSIWDNLEASDSLTRRDGDSRDVCDNDILAFAKVVVESSRTNPGDRNVSNSEGFARVLGQVISELTRRFRQRRGQSAEHRLSKPLLWHSLTLKGELATVSDMLAKDKHWQNHPDFVRAVTQLFLATLRLQTLRDAFQRLVPLWHVVVRHLDDASKRYQTGELGRESAELRKSVFAVFEDIEDPGAWVANVPNTPEAQTIAAHLFFMLFRERSNPDRAVQVFDDLQARRLPISFEAYLVLLKTFLGGRVYDIANRVYSSLRKQFPDSREKDELHTGLRLFSLQGDTKQAGECFQVMEARGFVDGGARRRILHAHAVNGDTERVHELFHEFFPPDDRNSPRPGYRDFREVIYAHVRAGDLEGINHWLDEMTKANIRPDLSVYNMIILAFATSSDLESASAVLARMWENDIKPDRISYTTVIAIMADRKDPVSAEQLYQRALDEGVEPDDIMTMALMNAHVEAGSWRGVIRAFDYLQQSPGRSTYHTTQLYNTLLKAYVLIGAPFRVVSNVFERFASLRLKPTEYTYALLIQSACDSGRMDIACGLFTQLDEVAVQERAKSHVNAYIMTIIMAGFLRNGNKERAKAVYDDMYARGIQPTAITFSVIIQSYANERSEESLQVAEDFMHSLLAAEDSQRAWIGSARGGRPKALESVFGPLMSIYGRQLDVAAVERQFDEMLAAGGQPTLVALTMLMDAYRRVDNVEGAEQIWNEIVEVALQVSQGDVFQRLPSPPGAPPRTRGGPQRQANILCLSLSVYIDALSTAGRHVDIATTWRQVKAWGFTFDAHNWNHLAVALVRAGEVERAFEIVERVLVPYQLQTRDFVRSRRKDPKTPLTFVTPVSDDTDATSVEGDEKSEAEEEDEAPRSPARPPNRRVQAVRSATRQQDGLTSLDGLESDPAQPLHELQQISLTWQAWRTHNVTLDALGAAMKRLQAGVRVRPAGQALPEDEDPRRMSPDEASEFYAHERQETGEILQRIYQNYPNAIALVERREMELHRLWDDATRSAYT